MGRGMNRFLKKNTFNWVPGLTRTMSYLQIYENAPSSKKSVTNTPIIIFRNPRATNTSIIQYNKIK
jgi:hypothetical protein